MYDLDQKQNCQIFYIPCKKTNGICAVAFLKYQVFWYFLWHCTGSIVDN